MKLTGKCKKDFIKQLNKNICFVELPEPCKNALIIEFFDLVGIYISIHYETFGSYYFNAMITKNHITINLRTHEKFRTEATNAAILKANDIYNENK